MIAPDRSTVHALASDILGPALASCGFGRSSRGYWRRSTRSGPEAVQLQLSKWNGVAPISEFTVNIVSAPPADDPNPPSRRLATTFEEPDLEAMRGLRNRVIERALVLADQGEHPLLRPETEPYRLYSDVWMNYADEVDLRIWLAFLAERLPTAIDRVRTNWWPGIGFAPRYP